MFGGRNKIIQIDMSEFSEKVSSSKLVGAARGYVGHEEGGFLTEKVRRNPYSVVLFDEVEKAHPEVLNTLLQVMEEGFLTDSRGRKVSFNNCVILMTGNVGGDIYKKSSMGFGASDTNIDNDLKSELSKAFRPEFINRIDGIVFFSNFDQKNTEKIVSLEICKIQKKISNKKITIHATAGFIKKIAKDALAEKMGARPIIRFLQEHMEDTMSRLFLKEELKENSKITFSVRKNKVSHSIKEELAD